MNIKTGFISLLFLFSASCANLVDEITPEIQKSKVTITDIDQTYYESLEEYGFVKIYYKIKNIGNVDIDYYKVYFKVTCTDGSYYVTYDNGLDLSPDNELSDYCYVATADKKYKVVEVLNIELNTY